MEEWDVDPDGVLGVLAGLDQLGPAFESAQTEATALRGDGTAALSADGRTVVSDAWARLMDRRALVPGKLMFVLSRASAGVGDATVEIVLGDEEMARTAAEAERHAEDSWGIPPLPVAQDPGF